MIDLNRKFQELYEKPDKEPVEPEVAFDDEEHVEEEDPLFDDEATEGGEVRIPKSITMLSDDEEEIKTVQPELLTMDKNGKLIKEKPKSTLVDMFKKAKERKKMEEESGSEIEPEELLPEGGSQDFGNALNEREKSDEKRRDTLMDNKSDEDFRNPSRDNKSNEDFRNLSRDHTDEQRNNQTDNNTSDAQHPKESNNDLLDENQYEEDAVPTAEDYERYKRMMSENRIHLRKS